MMESTTCLLRACINDDFDLVVRLLDAGCDVNWCNEDEVTPLQISSSHGNDQIVPILLSSGALIDKSNSSGCTPLMHAARHGQLSVLSQLIQNGANIHLENKLGSTALLLAVSAGHLSCVRRLLDSGASVDGNNVEVNPLIVAAQNGHDSLVKMLLDRGADINFSSPCSKLTPLMFAALNGHKSTAQILVERGANVDVKNIGDKTALDVAVIRGKQAVKGYLDSKTKIQSRKNNQIEETLLEATKNGNVSRVEELLLISPKEVDSVDTENGRTPLMFAAISGRLDLVKKLIKSGAQKNLKDKVNGWTALMHAIAYGQNEVAKYLVESGVDVNVKSHNGHTAFNLASLVDDLDTNLLQLLAAKTLFDDSMFNYSSNYTNNYDYSSDANLKAWWNRLSNRFRTLKFSRSIRQTPDDQECITPANEKNREMSSNQRIKSAFTRRPNKLAPITSWSSDDCLANTNNSIEIIDFSLNIDSPKLKSDLVESVIPPLGLDFSTSKRKFGMPTGKKMSRQKTINSIPPGLISNWFNLLPVNRERVTGCDGRSNKKSENSTVSSGTITPKISDVDTEDEIEYALSKTVVPTTNKLHWMLKKLSLLQWESVFEKEEVDFEVFLTLTDQDLMDLGFEDKSSRLLLLEAIREYNYTHT